MIAKIEERPPAKRKASREDVGSCDGERVGRHIVRVRSRGVVPQKSQRLESALRTPTRREVAVRGLQTEPVATPSVKQEKAAPAQHRNKMKRMFENATSGAALPDKDLQYVRRGCAALEDQAVAGGIEGECQDLFARHFGAV